MKLNETKPIASDSKQPRMRILIKPQIFGCQEYLAGGAPAHGGSGGASFAGDRDSIRIENRTGAFQSRLRRLNQPGHSTQCPKNLIDASSGQKTKWLG